MNKQEKTHIRTLIHNYLNDILNTVVSESAGCFEENELAYLILQEKGERQIRDKVAWELQNILSEKDDKLLVRMEWGPRDWQSHGSHQSPRVDLAVLLLNENRTDYVEVLAMVEFKYRALLTKDTVWMKQFKNDIKKMKKIAELASNNRDSECDIYYLFLQSNYKYDNNETYNRNDLKYGPSITYTYSNRKYHEISNNPNSFTDDLKAFYDKHFECITKASPSDLAKKGQKKHYPVVTVGKAFCYTLQMSMMLWGPFHKDDYCVN